MLVNQSKTPSWLPGSVWRYLVRRMGRKSAKLLRIRANRPLQEAREHLQRCTTNYAEKRLRSYVRTIPEELITLLDNIVSKKISPRSLKTEESRARRIETSLKTVERILEEDSFDAEQAQRVSDAQSDLSRRAGPVLTGAAEKEFHRIKESLRRLDLRTCYDRTKVREYFEDAHKKLFEMEAILSRAKKIRESLPLLEEQHRKLDRAIVSSDPKTNEDYMAVMSIIDQAKAAVARGDDRRAENLLKQTETKLGKLQSFVSEVGRYAVDEIQLWKRIAALCPATCSPFAKELADMEDKPAGDRLQVWADLKEKVAKVVRRAAIERRKANGATFKAARHRLELFSSDEKAVAAFATSAMHALEEVGAGL